MQGKIILTLSAVAAIVVALILNPMKFPAEQVKEFTKHVVSKNTDTVYMKVPVPYAKEVVNTKYIDRIRVIRDSFYTLTNAVVDTSLAHDLRGRFNASSNYTEKLQSENELLVEDKNTIVDVLSETTNELWKTKSDFEKFKSDSLPKRLKHGIGASVMFLGGNRPIYQITYEKPLTRSISIEGGVLWNDKPGVSTGIKIRF